MRISVFVPTTSSLEMMHRVRGTSARSDVGDPESSVRDPLLIRVDEPPYEAVDYLACDYGLCG